MTTASSLKIVFRNDDAQGCGTISRPRLMQLLFALDPKLSTEDVDGLFSTLAADMFSGDAVKYNDFIDFLTGRSGPARVPQLLVEFGEQDDASMLPSGIKQLSDFLSTADSSILQVCQEFAAEHGFVPRLLRLARTCSADEMRQNVADLLVHLVAGSESSVASVMSDARFVPSIREALQDAAPPALRLSALLVLHSCAARVGAGSCGVLADVVELIPPLLWKNQDEFFLEAAIEVLGLCALHCPSSVAQALSWSLLADMVAEDGNRPAWLASTRVQVLSCGLLATAVLKETSSDDESSEGMRRLMVARLSDGHLIAYLELAMAMAVKREEWPPRSGAFHLPWRLAASVKILADHGYAARLSNTALPLIDMIMTWQDNRTQYAALSALRVLCEDVDCVQVLLSHKDFHSHVLDPSASNVSNGTLHLGIQAYTANAERMLSSARKAQEAAAVQCHYAPSVTEVAKAFTRFRPLDAKLGVPQLLEALRLLTIGPSATVRSCLVLAKVPQKLSFQDFAWCVFGNPQTPDIEGLWAKLMEKAASAQALAKNHRKLMEKAASAQAVEVRSNSANNVPELATLLSMFEQLARGSCKPTASQLLEELLPILGVASASADARWQSSCNVCFAELNLDSGDPLEFPSFAIAVFKLCKHLSQASQ